MELTLQTGNAPEMLTVITRPGPSGDLNWCRVLEIGKYFEFASAQNLLSWVIAEAASSLDGFSPQQASPPGSIAPRPQHDLAVGWIDRSQARACGHQLAAALGVLLRLGESGPVALARGSLAASSSDRCTER